MNVMSSAVMTMDEAVSGSVLFGFSKRPDADEMGGLLSRLSIGTRIALLVVMALVTVLLTGALLVVSDRRMDRATAELSSYGDLVVLAASVERRVATMQIQARRFITER